MINHNVQHKQESVQKFNGYPNYIDISEGVTNWRENTLLLTSLLLGLIAKFKTDYNIIITSDAITFIIENGNLLFIRCFVVVDYSQAEFHYEIRFSDSHSWNSSL